MQTAKEPAPTSETPVLNSHATIGTDVANKHIMPGVTPRAASHQRLIDEWPYCCERYDYRCDSETKQNVATERLGVAERENNQAGYRRADDTGLSNTAGPARIAKTYPAREPQRHNKPHRCIEIRRPHDD